MFSPASIGDLLWANTLPSILVSSLCVVTLAGYYYCQNINKYWIKKGIKGPKPKLLIGNYDIFVGLERLKLELAFVKKYGKIYGVFQGMSPRLIVADPEMLVKICVKDFETFPNHELAEFSSKFAHMTLIKLKDGQWKRARALMSPTFTSSKIKRMFRFMEDCVEDLIDCIGEQFDVEPPKEVCPTPAERRATIDVREMYNYYTMDTITTCCYGLKLERCGTSGMKAMASRNEFIAQAMKVFETPIFRTLIQVLFPQKLLDFVGFKVTSDSVMEPLGNIVEHFIGQRRSSPKKFDDYLQSLIDARLDDKFELNVMDSMESHHVGLTRESMIQNQQQMIKDLKKGDTNNRAKILTDEEIVANAVFLLAVGVETTSSLLSNCTYALAFHPEIQDRLYEELLAITKYDENRHRYIFEYDELTSCQYLDAVLSETLRRLAPIITLDRISSRDYFMEKYNLFLPKGSQLFLSFHSVQMDPDYWYEPERFDPERFMPGNKEKIVPGSYCPFGLGPRHCIGMRFSLTEAKLALAKILMRYKFSPAQGKKFPPEHKLVLAVCNYKDLLVTVTRRAVQVENTHANES